MAMVFIVMGSLVWIVDITIGRMATAGDAAAVLGTIVPGIATVGAAVFGIPLAYQTGKAGKDEAVKESHATGVADGQKEAAKRIEGLLPQDEGGLAAMGAADTSAMIGKIRAELVHLLT